jgi:hypothetical protein
MTGMLRISATIAGKRNTEGRPMSHKLRWEKIVTLKVLEPLGQSNVQIARYAGDGVPE